MSAYLVEQEHIAELCKWTFSPQRHAHCWNMVKRRPIMSDGETWHKIPEAAKILAEANIASVKARYPDSPDMLIEDYVDLVIDESKKRANLELDAADIYSMAVCLDYQSCEVDNWHETDAYGLIKAIQAEAGRVMASRSKIKWTYSHDDFAAWKQEKRDEINAGYAKHLASKEAAQ